MARPVEHDIRINNRAAARANQGLGAWASGYQIAKDPATIIHEYGVMNSETILIPNKSRTDNGRCRKRKKKTPARGLLMGRKSQTRKNPANSDWKSVGSPRAIWMFAEPKSRRYFKKIKKVII